MYAKYLKNNKITLTQNYIIFMSHDLLVFYVYLYSRQHDTSRLSGTCGLSSLNKIICIELGKRHATTYASYIVVFYTYMLVKMSV